MLRKFLIAVVVIMAYAVSFPLFAENRYFRVTILADPHLPTKTRSVKKLIEQDKVMPVKEAVLDDINSWSDVNLVAALGDFVADFGSNEEFAFALDYFGKLKKPFAPVTGNHDYFYVQNKSDDTKIKKGTAVTKAEKLERFRKMMKLESLSYVVDAKYALLVFLSVDDTRGDYPVKLKDETVKWFSDILNKNQKNRPVIVFCHAPLYGTLEIADEKFSKAAYIEPRDDIEKIISKNKSIKLWVSGHTHTSTKDPNFMSEKNLYNGVLNLHNNDMDQLTIYSNNLFIYKDRVEIKTYNHKSKKWDKKFDRVVKFD